MIVCMLRVRVGVKVGGVKSARITQIGGYVRLAALFARPIPIYRLIDAANNPRAILTRNLQDSGTKGTKPARSRGGEGQMMFANRSPTL